MTEYELADLAGAAMSNFLTSFTVFLSIVTAYVVAAFVAGTRMSRGQVVIVNTCFLIASGTMGLLSVLIFQVFFSRAHELAIVRDSALGNPVTLDLSLVVSVLYLILIGGSLVFMHTTRGKRADN